MSFKVPENHRLTRYSSPAHGNNGAFIVVSPHDGRDLKIICSDGMGWEHVSVSRAGKPPTWTEMCFVKDLFWDQEDVVVQYHPRKSEYVNNHVNCLHLWRKIDFEFPTPPTIMIGIK